MTTELIAFLDADDLWLPDKLALQEAALAADPGLDLVYGHVEQFISPELPDERRARLVCPAGVQPARLISALLARRSAWTRVGPLATDLRTGWFIDWASRAADLGLRHAGSPAIAGLAPPDPRRQPGLARSGRTRRLPRGRETDDAEGGSPGRHEADGTGIPRPSRPCSCMRRSDRGPSSAAAWSQWKQGGGDIDTLDHRSFRLLALVAKNLAEQGVPDPDLGRLRGVRRRSWVEHINLMRRVAPYAGALVAGGLEILFLKGVVLAPVYYGDLGLRMLSDVDVLVHWRDVPRAIALLAQVGVTPHGSYPPTLARARWPARPTSPTRDFATAWPSRTPRVTSSICTGR